MGCHRQLSLSLSPPWVTLNQGTSYDNRQLQFFVWSNKRIYGNDVLLTVNDNMEFANV